MTSKKDQALIDHLKHTVDRLTRMLATAQDGMHLAQRQVEIMQTRHGYTDEEIDAVRREAANDQ